VNISSNAAAVIVALAMGLQPVAALARAMDEMASLIAIKAHYPDVYAVIVTDIRNGVGLDASESEIRKATYPQLTKLFLQQAPKASDANIVRLLQIGQETAPFMLERPNYCFDAARDPYLWDDDYAAALPEALWDRGDVAIADLLRQTATTPAVASAQLSTGDLNVVVAGIVGAMTPEERRAFLATSQAMQGGGALTVEQKASLCGFGMGLIREVSLRPPSEAAALYRVMLSMQGR